MPIPDVGRKAILTQNVNGPGGLPNVASLQADVSSAYTRPRRHRLAGAHAASRLKMHPVISLIIITPRHIGYLLVAVVVDTPQIGKEDS